MKTSKSRLLKIFAFGTIIATPMLFMTSCSSAEPGTRFQPKIISNDDKSQSVDSLTKSTTVKAALQDFVPIAASTHLLNNNNVFKNVLINNTSIKNQDDDKTSMQAQFNALMSLPYVSGSGPFINTNNDIGLALTQISVKNDIDSHPELKDKPTSETETTSTLNINSIQLTYSFYNRYSEKHDYNESEVRSILKTWIDEGNVVDETLKNAMTNAKPSYTVDLSFAGSYTFTGKKDADWVLSKANWTFAGAIGSSLQGNISYDSKTQELGKGGTHQLATALTEAISKSQNYEFNTSGTFYEDVHNKYAGLVKSIA